MNLLGRTPRPAQRSRQAWCSTTRRRAATLHPVEHSHRVAEAAAHAEERVVEEELGDWAGVEAVVLGGGRVCTGVPSRGLCRRAQSVTRLTKVGRRPSRHMRRRGSALQEAVSRSCIVSNTPRVSSGRLEPTRSSTSCRTGGIAGCWTLVATVRAGGGSAPLGSTWRLLIWMIYLNFDYVTLAFF
jgi:hypothetical protein